MADLTGILSATAPETVINAWYEARYTPRTWLGLSEVGHPCGRYLWYVHHGYQRPDPPGQTLRLFRFGDLIEDLVVQEMLGAGYNIHSRQKEVEFNDGPLTLTGHIDGIVEGLIESKQPHLLEVKSANEKSFNDLKKKRSYEAWNPKYKGQVHIYALGLKLTRILAVVVNKNTSEMYTERIKTDREYAIARLVDVFRDIQSPAPPERKCPNASWFEAKFCGYYKECFK